MRKAGGKVHLTSAISLTYKLNFEKLGIQKFGEQCSEEPHITGKQCQLEEPLKQKEQNTQIFVYRFCCSTFCPVANFFPTLISGLC